MLPTGRTTLDNNDVVSSLDLHLVIHDRNVLEYLAQFKDEEVQCEKALEALKVGVIAIQSASPTLDTQVVQAKFVEVESRMKEQMTEFQRKVSEDLVRYFADQDGVLPRSLDGFLGESGALARTFQTFFDPHEGRLARLMQAQIGPESTLGKTLDPQNKQGVIALIEKRVQELVEAKLEDVLKQFSLDEDTSAMSRLHSMLSGYFGQLNQSLGLKAGAAKEAARGHVKGFVFEDDLYAVFAELGRQLGDETESVGGLVGSMPRNKRGDFVATLGETSGAPGQRIVVEVKDTTLRLRDAIDELQEAKANRQAECGIFVFARGVEPSEIGDFRRIGEDFYVTVDKELLSAGQPLIYLDAAYKIARALTVAAKRREQAGELDLQFLQDQLQALAVWSERISDMSTKARTIQSSGKLIESCVGELKTDLDTRITAMLQMLNKGQTS